MLGLACLAGFAAGKNMIPGEYAISNPNRLVKARFTGEFSDEYFEVYSPPIKSQYAQVFWTLMEPVPLDPALVKRFANKTVAITGYEVDQVSASAQLKLNQKLKKPILKIKSIRS